MGLRELALFAGAGGGILGGRLLGWRTICAVESNAYCRDVLLSRQRDGLLERFPIWDDVCTFNGVPWRGYVDVISGGFPCQDISSAGTKAGISGSKSILWQQMFRIVCEIRPRYVYLENSRYLVNRGLSTILRKMARLGYNAKWGVLGARHVKAGHKRDRCWVLFSYSYGDCESASAVYAEVAGLQSMGRESRKSRRDSLRRVGRGAYAVAGRMDRLKAIGNGQVPSVAALAWRILTADEQAAED